MRHVSRPMSAATAALRLVRGELPRDVSDSPMQPAGVYFNHMRKAAGSTTIAWFQHIGQARNFYVTAMEFSFFASTAWLTCHPSSFVVVTLREPISRHVSEYHTPAHRIAARRLRYATPRASPKHTATTCGCDGWTTPRQTNPREMFAISRSLVGNTLQTRTSNIWAATVR